MPRYFLELSFNGNELNGWQIQSNTTETIQQYLADVLSKTLRENIMPIGCGRTDAGVHAKQFFAHFDSQHIINHPFDFWIHKWNSMLPEKIAIHKIIPVKDDAHARYSAISRTYEYYIHQRKNPFTYNFSWYYPFELHHQKIQEAIQIISKFNDFACFTKDADEYNNTLCNITEIEWRVQSPNIIFKISANRFLRNMVRAIVGTLIEVGREKISLDELVKIIESKDRQKAGFSAPPQGLHLTKIIYPEEIFIE